MQDFESELRIHAVVGMYIVGILLSLNILR